MTQSPESTPNLREQQAERPSARVWTPPTITPVGKLKILVQQGSVS